MRTRLSAMLSGWLREPLVHFLIAGAAVFAFAGWRGTAVDPASRTIIIAVDDVQRMAERFVQTWQRQPTADEIDAMIRDEIKDEVYAREATRLGLADGDAIIRRRLRGKMEFLARAEVDAVMPTDTTLTAWIAKNPARYADGARHDFDQIFFVATDPARAQAAAVAARAALDRGADWQTLGEAISLPRTMAAADDGAIDATFGAGFAAALAKAPLGRWAGPVTSGFGLHLIRVRARTAGKPPVLADVRQRVENDWRAATAADREARAYQLLLDAYRIKIDKP
ncbi:MAG: hypothetical protein RLZZ58_151 [Pseudomonadota bacterium]|jgi:hypothetical protein